MEGPAGNAWRAKVVAEVPHRQSKLKPFSSEKIDFSL